MWHAPARQTGAETEIINDSYVISFSSRAVPKLVPGVGVVVVVVTTVSGAGCTCAVPDSRPNGFTSLSTATPLLLPAARCCGVWRSRDDPATTRP